jgi:hypothetical protein
VRVLPHIKKLDDCFGDFLVRVTCPCGLSRHIKPEALARIAERVRCPPLLRLVAFGPIQNRRFQSPQIIAASQVAFEHVQRPRRGNTQSLQCRYWRGVVGLHVKSKRSDVYPHHPWAAAGAIFIGVCDESTL